MSASPRALGARRTTSVVAALAMLVTLLAAPPAHSDDGASATVSGRLTVEGTQEPPAGLGLVELHAWSGTDWSVAGVGDVLDGTFSFHAVAPGTYTLFFDAPPASGVYTQYLGGRPDQPRAGDTTSTFDVAGGQVTAQDFELARPRELAIDFRFVAGGDVPTAGRAALFRWSQETEQWEERDELFVDDVIEGAVVGDLPVGRYVVESEWEEPTDYPAQVAGGLLALPDPAAPEVFEVRTGQPSTVRYQAVQQRGGRITAHAVGDGASELLVRLDPGGDRQVPPSGDVDLLLLPGSYSVTVAPGSPESALRGRTFAQVPVTAGGTTALGEIDLRDPEGPFARVELLLANDFPEVGDVLGIESMTVVPSHATTSFQWARDGVDIAGATGPEHRVGIADVGSEMSVTVTAQAPGFQFAAAMATTMDPVPPVEAPLSLAVSGQRQTFGSSDPVTVTVSAPALRGIVLDGEVEVDLLVDGDPAGRRGLTDGTARFTLPADLPVGTHTIGARFDPSLDGRVLGDEVVPVEVTVDPAPPVPPEPAPPAAPMASTVELRRSMAKQPFRAAGKRRATLTGTVTLADGSTGGGHLVFAAGGRTLGRVPVVGGRATFRLPRSTTVGRYAVTARFEPTSTTVSGSTSSPVRVRVVKAKAKVTGKLAMKRARAGKRAKYRIRVKVAGVARPTGRLVIRDGKKRVRSVRLKAKHKGRVTVRLPRLSKGKHRIRVVYQGNASIKKKASKRATVRVR